VDWCENQNIKNLKDFDEKANSQKNHQSPPLIDF